MDILHEVIEVGILLATLAGAVGAYFRFRGRSFGISDLLIFGTLAIGSDVACYTLFKAVAGPHADSAAYEALAGLLVLFALVPLAAGFNIVALAAGFVCLLRHPPLRYAALVAAVLAWLGQGLVSRPDDLSAPGRGQATDKLAGEHWALESGASSRQDCDRQSTARAFREGCYARLPR